MSSQSFVAYYGVKFDVADDELEGLEERTDLRIVASRKNNLSWYFGVFGAAENSYTLLIGYKIGIFGHENEGARSLSYNDLERIVLNTNMKLKAAGIEGEGCLHFMFQPDH